MGGKMRSSTILALVVATIFCLSPADAIKRSEIRTPPTMIRQPPQDQLLFQVAVGMDEKDKPFILECEAQGSQPIKYRWYKSGRIFEFQVYDKRVSQQPGRGTLVFTKPSDVDEGYYNCTATNELGTSVSNSVMVRKADLGSFPDEPVNEVVVKEGEPLTLQCSPPTGFPKPNIFWIIQSTAAGALRSINSSRITVDPEGRLHFSNVTAFDSHDDAYYACSASNVFRNEYKLGNRVKLTVLSAGSQAVQSRHPPVEQYRSPPNIVARRGEPQEMHCIFGGTPLPEIRWRRKNGHLDFSRFTVLNYGKTLKLKKVDFEDAGTYECTASNGVGSAESHAVAITVQSVPYWLAAPNNTNAAEGETVRFECKASGVPEPETKWFINGVPIDKTAPNTRRRLESPTILRFDKLEKIDTAVIQCNASNTLGYAFKDFYLNVIAVEPEIYEPPAALYEAVDGQPLTLRCRVFGAPQPLVSWIRNGKELTGGRYATQDNGDLSISAVQFTDAGRYKCVATNKLGRAESDQELGHLEVKERTRITAEPIDYEVAAGNAATFRCNAVQDESLTLKINWLSNGHLIDWEEDPRLYQGPDMSLTITKTTELDSGTYTCIAETRLDNVNASATLIVQDVPNPPKLLNIRCLQKTAQVEWQPMGDNRAPILSFIIQYNTSFTPDTWQNAFENVPAADLNFDVSMSPWANYTFRVIARNKIGLSLPSGHSQVCETPPDVPFSNPEKVQGQGDRPNNLVISWTQMPAIEHNGPGFFYRVFWKRDNTGEDWSTADIADWQQTQFVVDNQPTYQPYRIKVEAHNSKGQANVAATEVIGHSGEDFPLEAPRDLRIEKTPNADATTALLYWKPVSPQSVRGHFKGYKIQTWTVVEGADRRREMIVAANLTSSNVNMFVPDEINFVRVLVFNGQYDGPPSNVINFKAEEGKPGPVTSLEAFPMGSSAFKLVWKEPKQKNGQITGYRIYYEKVVGTKLLPMEERDPIIKDPSATESRLVNLEPGTKYRLTIRATTRKGPGSPYFIEATTKNETAKKPDKPTFNWRSLYTEDQRAAVLVVWKPDLNGNPGTHFFVEYRKKGDTQWSETKEVLYEDAVVVSGLDPGTLYEIVVVAVDGKHYTRSDVEEVETDGLVVAQGMPYNYATTAWFVGMMVAIFILLVILIIVCLVKRNRGGKYSVHEKEAAQGKDLDYPEDGTGFPEFSPKGPGEKNNVKGSRTSLNSSNKPGESDTDSMAEYGDGETGKFTEDGSFIGQYGTATKTSPSAHATFV